MRTEMIIEANLADFQEHQERIGGAMAGDISTKTMPHLRMPMRRPISIYTQKVYTFIFPFRT